MMERWKDGDLMKYHFPTWMGGFSLCAPKLNCDCLPHHHVTVISSVNTDWKNTARHYRMPRMLQISRGGRDGHWWPNSHVPLSLIMMLLNIYTKIFLYIYVCFPCKNTTIIENVWCLGDQVPYIPLISHLCLGPFLFKPVKVLQHILVLFDKSLNLSPIVINRL